MHISKTCNRTLSRIIRVSRGLYIFVTAKLHGQVSGGFLLFKRKACSYLFAEAPLLGGWMGSRWAHLWSFEDRLFWQSIAVSFYHVLFSMITSLQKKKKMDDYEFLLYTKSTCCKIGYINLEKMLWQWHNVSFLMENFIRGNVFMIIWQVSSVSLYFGSCACFLNDDGFSFPHVIVYTPSMSTLKFMLTLHS